MFLVLTVKGVGFFKEQFLGIALFCIAYLAQFFVDLDKEKKANIEDYDASKDETEEINDDVEIVNSEDEEETDDSF